MTPGAAGCRLVVNADDLGLSEAVNEGIAEGHRRGLVTAASLMACGQAFDHGADLARRLPGLDPGVHLTLVGEAPLLPPDRVPSLVGADGRFLPAAGAFARRYAAGAVRPDELAQELGAQVARVLARGLRPSHLDSHQHLHVLPGVLRVAVDLAQRHQIPFLRWPAEALGAAALGTPGRALELLALRAVCGLAGRPRAVRTLDRFTGFLAGGRLDPTALAGLFRALPPGGTCELMCHPGRPDPGSRHRHWGYRWADELGALTDPAARDVLAARGVRLTSFRELAAE
ncbi:MAG: carbohydrate deacetylase, partial [Deferrisomatales bacterium]